MKIIVYDKVTGKIQRVQGATGTLFDAEGKPFQITTTAHVLEQAFGKNIPANLAAIEVDEDFQLPDGKIIKTDKVVDDPDYVPPKAAVWDGVERRKTGTVL